MGMRIDELHKDIDSVLARSGGYRLIFVLRNGWKLLDKKTMGVLKAVETLLS
jgi:hypothetical protein